MSDYSRYKTETLEKMLLNNEIKYREALKRFDQLNGWGAGMRRVHCDLGWKNVQKYEKRIFSIKEELCKRNTKTT